MYKHVFFLCLLFFAYGCGREGVVTSTPDNPSPPLEPLDELATFVLEPDLKIELVASEPLVQDPVVMLFDEDGRLWVVEMRGFMPDIDGLGEKNPVGRINVLEDTNGDGTMDISTLYLDSLMMPRALALVPGGALVVENQKLWLTQDLNHDLKADSKTLIDSAYAGSPLPEHSGNGLLRAMDNWYYNAKSRFRYHLVDGAWIRDSTEFRGQWGISQDDEGKLYYNYNWSQLHADLVPPNYLSRNKNHTPTTGIDHGLTIDRRVYPIRANPAVNRGYIPGTLNEQGKLIEFTAACSPFYYRGTALPKAYYGNVFVCEPSGNLVKRNVVEKNGYMVSAKDPHPGTEFLASTDERFRPVYLTTGPDGALYLADMYRGLIQHGEYVTPYLREQTLTRKLDKPVNRGRIWRIVPKTWTAPALKKISAASSQELVQLLSHPNAWQRDMAQRLLVERKDNRLGYALTNVVLHGNDPFGRLHALWTLEGLHLLQPDVLFTIRGDKNESLRIAATRMLENIARKDKAVRAKLGAEIQKNWSAASPAETLQLALTAGVLDQQESHKILANIADHYDTSALIRDAILSSLQNQELPFLKQMVASKKTSHTPADEIFLEMLTTSLVKKGNPSELKSLLTMLDVNKPSFGWSQKTILTALSIQGANRKGKPVRLTAEPGILKRKDLSIDSSRRNVLANMFEWPGHKVDTASQKKRALSESDQKLFALGRQHYLTTCSGCHGSDGGGLNRFAPPLINSDWVLGNEKRLALIILQGIEGPIEVAGKKYDAPDILPIMPSHSTMDDGAILAIMTYIRNEWGNTAPPISRRTVGKTRHTSQGRVVPWTASELNKHMEEDKLLPETEK